MARVVEQFLDISCQNGLLKPKEKDRRYDSTEAQRVIDGYINELTQTAEDIVACPDGADNGGVHAVLVLLHRERLTLRIVISALSIATAVTQVLPKNTKKRKITGHAKVTY